MGKNKQILETFVKCPNCRRLKNANYTTKDKEIAVVCFCGTNLKKKLK